MDYYLPNGEKWTLDKGDWQSYKHEERKKKRQSYRIISYSIYITVVAIVSFLIVTAFK